MKKSIQLGFAMSFASLAFAGQLSKDLPPTTSNAPYGIAMHPLAASWNSSRSFWRSAPGIHLSLSAVCRSDITNGSALIALHFVGSAKQPRL
jgi:hypothetical protein